MKKTVRQYPKGCEWCNATGYVKTHNPHPEVTTAITNICPVCTGSGVITVTETIEEPDPVFDQIAGNLTEW